MRTCETYTLPREVAIRTVLRLSAALLVSIIVGALAAVVAVEVLPCYWFGSGVEGACAYGVLWTSIVGGLTVAVLSFGYLCYRVLRRGGRTASPPA